MLRTCFSPAWWLWRSVHTRSHPELGRKSLQRQWYFVLRRGRVGRCQACEKQETPFIHDANQHHQKPARRNAWRVFVVELNIAAYPCLNFFRLGELNGR
jgi:hypothetical protein